MSELRYRLPILVAAVLLSTFGSALAANNAGPEPYEAADPQYARPMTQEPHIGTPTPDIISLGSADDIEGPAAGPEPHSAPSPR